MEYSVLGTELSSTSVILAIVVVLGLVCMSKRKTRKIEETYVNVDVEVCKGKEVKYRLPVQRWITKGSGRKVKKIILLTYGTRGDIQPMIALALEIMKETGLEVSICAPRSFEEFIRKFGVKYVYAGVDDVEQPQDIFKQNSTSFADVMGVLNRVYSPLAEGMWKACQEMDCDLIITTALARSFSMHIAEKLGIGCMCVHFVSSDVMTGSFPPIEYMDSLLWFKRTLPMLTSFANKSLYVWRGLQILRAAVSTGLAESDVAFRTKILGLPKGDPMVGINDVNTQPSFHAYSSVVQPRPKDWPDNVMITGYWHLKHESAQEMTEKHRALNEFLDKAVEDNVPVVFVTFGSMEQVDDLIRTASDACSVLEARLVVGDTRAKKSKLDLPQGVFLCDFNIPHDTIFPRCSVLIHHGGAGTTAAALRSGSPSVVIPVLPWSDQPYWASVVQERKCGIALDRTVCSHETLALAITHCISEKVALKSKLVAKALEEERNSGCKIAAQVVKTYGNEIYK